MKLLVGYLATSGGADAVALAVRLARTVGADLELCMVLPPTRAQPDATSSEGYQDVLAEQAHQWLADARALVPDDVRTDTHLMFDDAVAERLAAEALRLEADAIVVGGAGGGLAGGYSLGSVVNDLLHSAPVPVAVAPRGTRHSDVDRVRSVTCAIGTRPGAKLLLDTAVSISKAAGTPLRLVSLVALDQHAIRRSDDTAESIRAQALRHAAATLDTAKSELPASFPVTSAVVDGPTVEAAVDKLEWHDGDLIMVGSSRLAQRRRLFLGSTAAKMLRVLQIPIVVVPRDDASIDSD